MKMVGEGETNFFETTTSLIFQLFSLANDITMYVLCRSNSTVQPKTIYPALNS